MFRKLLLTSVASLGLLSPLAVAPKADAHERHFERHHEHAFRVYFRVSCHRGWSSGATFHSRREAERFLQELGERLQKFGLALPPEKTRLIVDILVPARGKGLAGRAGHQPPDMRLVSQRQ